MEGPNRMTLEPRVTLDHQEEGPPHEIFAHPRLISIVYPQPQRKKEKRRPSALSLSLTLRPAASAPGPAATVLRLTACRPCLGTPVRPLLLPPALVKRFRFE
ncbi:hypothetical protein L1887_27208 [Cichorium endivia]|nr:hypothetical protein L1887_27208 [Cichorium endivia]